MIVLIINIDNNIIIVLMINYVCICMYIYIYIYIYIYVNTLCYFLLQDLFAQSAAVSACAKSGNIIISSSSSSI